MTTRTDKILGLNQPEPSPEPKIFLKTDKDVSQEFHDAWVHTGSIRGTCEYCHRTYFNSAEGYAFDEGELENLKELAEESPELYIEVDYTVNTINGMHGDIVIGCACGMDVYMQNWLWVYRHDILGYLSARIKKEFEDKKEEYDKITKIEKTQGD